MNKGPRSEHQKWVFWQMQKLRVKKLILDLHIPYVPPILGQLLDLPILICNQEYYRLEFLFRHLKFFTYCFKNRTREPESILGNLYVLKLFIIDLYLLGKLDPYLANHPKNPSQWLINTAHIAMDCRKCPLLGGNFRDFVYC